MKIIVTILALLNGPVISRAAPPAAAADHPCVQIAEACRAAGFIPKDFKEGDGLWRDCVDPIMQGKTVVPGATKPLPIVKAATVAACKTKNSKFGSGKVGS